MHNDFADWYRLVSIEMPDLTKRYTALDPYVESLDLDDALELVRFFIRRAPKDASFSDRLSAVFKITDETFPMRNNETELRLLAGTAIAEILSKRSGEFADAVALAVLSANFNRDRNAQSQEKEIVLASQQYLESRSLKIREKVNFVSALAAKDLMKKVGGVKKVCKENGTVQTLEEPLNSCLKEFVDLSDTLLNNQNILQEETNVLWWLLGESSRSLKRKFKTFKPSVVALLAGKELADLSILMPGPYAMGSAFLSKVLGKEDGELAVLEQAITDSPAEWRKGLTASTQANNAIDLCPILLSIVRSVELGDGNFRAVAEKTCGVSIHDRLTLLNISYQFFTESLFIKSTATLEE